ncbi:MAG TPA: beta-galactosidase [Gaiellaceae bacterium]
MTKVRVEHRLLRVGERLVPLVAGEVQFWRFDPSDWEAALRSVANEGIPIVSTYLSWRRHAPEPDAPFAWRHDERLDVRRFLQLCAKHDLLVQLKPGPWICAEEPNGGYPDWLVADRELLALDASGNPLVGYNPPFRHPVPCYLHPRYLEHSRHWIQTFHEHVRDFIHPQGPVALIQLDNEPSYCFRDGMYEADYHPVALRAFAQWTLERYDGSLRRIQRAWEIEVPTDESIKPPRLPLAAVEAGSGRWRQEHDWICFREWLLGEHLRRLREYHEAAGATSTLFTINYNTHLVDEVPQSSAAIHTATGAIGGMDQYYEPPLDGDDLLAVARSTALARANGEPLPWSPELQAGIWRSPGEQVAYPDPTAEEQELYYLAALAFGLKGLNFYMLVNRENWEFAPIEPGGAASAYLTGVRKVVRLISQLPEFGELEPVSPVALAWQMSYARDAYAAGSDVPRSSPYAVMTGAFSALTRAGYLPRIWNTEREPPNDIAAIVTPTASYMSRAVQEHLAEMQRKGVLVILLGEPPRVDEEGKQCEVLADALVANRVDSQSATTRMLQALRTGGVEAPVSVAERDGFAVLQTGSDRQLLFALNARAERSNFRLRFASEAITALLPLGGDNAISVASRAAEIELGPHSGAVFEVVT